MSWNWRGLTAIDLVALGAEEAGEPGECWPEHDPAGPEGRGAVKDVHFACARAFLVEEVAVGAQQAEVGEPVRGIQPKGARATGSGHSVRCSSAGHPGGGRTGSSGAGGGGSVGYAGHRAFLHFECVELCSTKP